MESEPHLHLDLPQELVERVIDCLSNDTDALKICSLISRSWLPRARDHLFETLSLPCRANTPGFIIMSESGDISWEEAQEVMEELIRFLCFDSRLSTSVKHLTLDSRGSDMFARAFARVVPFLPFTQLTSFSVLMFPIGEMGQDGIGHLQTFLNANEGIELLSFRSTGFEGRAVLTLLQSCVYTLRSLRHLSLTDVGFYSRGLNVTHGLCPEKRKIDSLTLEGGLYLFNLCDVLFKDNLSARFDLSELRVLRITPHYVLELIDGIIDLCPESLTRLELDLKLQTVSQANRPAIERLTNLHHLIIKFHHKYSQENLLLLLQAVTHIASLQSFTLHCHSPECTAENFLTNRVHESLLAISRRLKGQNQIKLILPSRVYSDLSLAPQFTPEREGGMFRIIESYITPEAISD